MSSSAIIIKLHRYSHVARAVDDASALAVDHAQCQSTRTN